MLRVRLLVACIATALLAAALAFVAAPAAAAPAAAAPAGVPRASAPSLTFPPDGSPPGANDYSCRSAAHPDPVVLVHGTFANGYDNWTSMSPYLAGLGYCVFSFTYGQTPSSGGVGGLTDIAASAGQLKAFVDKVLSATGATKVDLVGHSQGGMMPRYYLKFLGGAAKVDRFVGLAPSNHGTTAGGLFQLMHLFPGGSAFMSAYCQACVQQEQGSAFLQHLNAGGDTVPGVHYTVIATTHDEVVTPYRSQFLSGPDVHNITVQSACPLDLVGHAGLAWDTYVLHLTADALDPTHPVPAPCSFGLPA